MSCAISIVFEPTFVHVTPSSDAYPVKVSPRLINLNHVPLKSAPLLKCKSLTSGIPAFSAFAGESIVSEISEILPFVSSLLAR